MSEDIKLEIIQKTQKTLGKYVKKPALTDKLLKKPPFRFLHDVITAIIKETGFLKGLFSEDELNSTNFTEKDSKVAFLNKLIDAIKVITKTELKIKASKVVAGLEPAETNLLLQTIAKAIDKKIDSTEYVQNLKKSTKVGADKKKLKPSDEKVKKASKPPVGSEEKPKRSTIKKSSSNETPKSTDRSSTKESKIKSKDVKEKSKNKVKSKEKKPKEKLKESPKEKVQNLVTSKNEDVTDSATPKDPVPPGEVVERKLSTENESGPIEIKADGELIEETEKPVKKSLEEANTELETKQDVEPQPEETEQQKIRASLSSASLTRPKSARPKSGDKNRISSSKNKNLEIDTNQPSAPLEISNTVVQPPPVRPKSMLRPPSVRPSSARPGAPRLRPDSALPLQETVTMGNINVIVENVDIADDEETVVIHNTSEMNEENEPELNIPLENKGHLVEQILEQIHDGEVDEIRKKVDIDWEQDGINQSSTAKEVVQLRSLIQSLTKTANPLGKLMNYLHEDIEAMHNELQVWINTKKQLFLEIDKQKRMSAESDKPLLVHLEQLQQEIKKQEQEIITVRSNILRNETRIKELLVK